MATEKELIDAFARAIATEEGFYKQGRIPTISQRLGNPGDLRSWKDRNGRPYPTANGFARFPHCQNDACVHPDHPSEVGFEALRQQCRINILKRGLTFKEFFAGKRDSRGKLVYGGYAPSADKNDPFRYAQHVLAYCRRRLALPENITIDTVIASLIDRPAAEQAA